MIQLVDDQYGEGMEKGMEKGDKRGRVEENGGGGEGCIMALWDGRPWD